MRKGKKKGVVKCRRRRAAALPWFIVAVQRIVGNSSLCCRDAATAEEAAAQALQEMQRQGREIEDNLGFGPRSNPGQLWVSLTWFAGQGQGVWARSS